jgi:hypothetical protein
MVTGCVCLQTNRLHTAPPSIGSDSFDLLAVLKAATRSASGSQRLTAEATNYFESPPLQEAIGNRDVISVLKAAIPVWKAETF